VADSKQFGSPKGLQFGDKTGGEQSGDSAHCAQCEAMLADALDGTLSAADQELFDQHMAACGPCSRLLADARRGAAFLEMLRNPAPEPPAALLERILAETSGPAVLGGVHPAALPAPAAGHFGVAALVPGHAIPAAAYGKVLPFPRRAAAAFRASAFGQIMMQPRLAMTAAMAFFSLTLTMNLMGIHPLSLRPSDLAPSSLKRDFYSANAHVVQYYEGLRVVYELESRVHDLQTAQDSAAAQPSDQPTGQSGPANPDQPGNPSPAGQSGPARQNAAPNPGSNPPARKRPAPNPGTSLREDFKPSRRLVAGSVGSDPGSTVSARAERKLV
jgi:hypothetical protein